MQLVMEKDKSHKDMKQAGKKIRQYFLVPWANPKPHERNHRHAKEHGKTDK